MTTSLDESYRLLAAEYVRKQAKQLAEQLDGARRAEDIEFVHRARVASRRLRAAMRMFDGCFKSKQSKRWRKQIRRVTAGLGDARDKDVQIEYLCTVLNELQEKACYPGIARLLVKLEQQRERLQSTVIEAADRLQASGVLDEMTADTKQILSQAKACELSVRSPIAFDRTEQHIIHNLDRMLPFQDSLSNPGDKQRHHAMRIAAKRLRYTLEISDPVHAGKLGSHISAVKRLQTLLGEIHDCDVWAEHLQIFAAKQRRQVVKRTGRVGPFARLEVGLEHLRQDRHAHREQTFRELGKYWHELCEQQYWERLIALVRSRGQDPGQSPTPTIEQETLRCDSSSQGRSLPRRHGATRGDEADERMLP